LSRVKNLIPLIASVRTNRLLAGISALLRNPQPVEGQSSMIAAAVFGLAAGKHRQHRN